MDDEDPRRANEPAPGSDLPLADVMQQILFL
jgi:hypothetical protein